MSNLDSDFDAGVSGWTVPRLADGRPDLQGIWANDSATPLQRPEALGERTELSEEEVAAFQAYAAEYDSAGGDAVFGDTIFRRALASVAEPDEAGTASRDPAIRCRGGGAVLSGRGYNSNYQIFQTSDYVAIQIEMHHETRLIPIDNAAPGRAGPRSATGSSRGHWDGDTLVVETSNLTRGTGGSTRDVRVTERFTRVGPELLQYEYTLDDPSTWTQPWTARVFMRPTPGTGVLYESRVTRGTTRSSTRCETRGSSMRRSSNAHRARPWVTGDGFVTVRLVGVRFRT